MPVIKIHPDFKYQNRSYADALVFLSEVEKKDLVSYQFLKSLFDDNDVITVQTSGSTGKPKEFLLSKQAMLHSAEATGQFFNLQPKTKALHCLSTDFIAGKMMWVRALHLGWHLDVVNVDSNPLSHTNDHYDFAAMVPMQAENSLEELHRVKKLIIGGAPISVVLEDKLKKLPTTVYQTYGMTETITHIAVKEISNKKTYYKCLPNVRVTTDKRECLLIDAPRITKEQLITNDIVKIINENQFEWLGRFDNVINSGGVKLFPEQIEAKLAPFIDVPFIIGAIPDDKLGQKVVLIIEKDLSLPNLEGIYNQAGLIKYEIPKKYYLLDKFLRTKNNKIRRRDVLQKFY